MKKKNPNAVKLGQLERRKRALTLSPEERSHIARKASKARSRKLSAAERRRIAMPGIKARQKKRRAR